MIKNLSVIVLTKNEEEIISDCLDNLKNFGKELLVIDSGSTDRTFDICERFGARVLKNTFADFSEQRNFAIKKAKGEWVLYIDADERVTEKFKKEVGAIIENHEKESGVDGYFLQRNNYYFGKEWGLIDRVQRLFYKPNFKEWYGVVHETPKIEGKFGLIESPISHFTHRNLSQMTRKTNEWSEFEAELRFKAHHPVMRPWRFLRVMTTAFLSAYIKRNGYKNGTEGIIESIYQSFSMFITYAKLWERQNKK